MGTDACPAPAGERRHPRRCCCYRLPESTQDNLFFGIVGLVMIAAIAGVGIVVVLDRAPRYAAAIASVSGLDPAADLGRRAALDPEFNLTLRVASRSPVSGACLGGVCTAVDVSYRGVRLAGGQAPRLCAASRHAAEVGRVMAWGTAVRVPGFALDSLAEDMRRGAAAFDVTLTSPGSCCNAWLGWSGTTAPCRLPAMSPPCHSGGWKAAAGAEEEEIGWKATVVASSS
ncbi:hypothetical protein ACP70R_026644 [Stipagrostis hirtigluma subsp. patula]